MKAFEQIERLRRMNQLIKSERTGSPEEFARTLRISRRQLFNYLDEIKSLGVEIGYSKASRSYYFNNGHELELDYSVKVLSKKDIGKVEGGFRKLNFHSAFFVHPKCLTCLLS
jgi:biotin operon repressor